MKPSASELLCCLHFSNRQAFIVKKCIFQDTIDKFLSKSTVLTNVGDIKVGIM